MSGLTEIESRIHKCQDCPLSKTRVRAVPGEGSEHPDIMFIGEGPGFHEDQQGRPFVGASGKYLDHLLASINLQRKDVFITNVVKCRPPNNRDPQDQELEACDKHLTNQIEALQPKILITLGRVSLNRFCPGERISNIHGKPRLRQDRVLIPMYHPAAALHQNRMRQFIEEDFKNLPVILAKALTTKDKGTEPTFEQPRLF
ncbi:uracil-DNA glycosylase [SAR202 cluster bacterium AD-802-E10_MRT_200m]|nr:uracil-DNA glycosylase [SAR202 cluster bacterium AD-802-E10_MRT_200m]